MNNIMLLYISYHLFLFYLSPAAMARFVRLEFGSSEQIINKKESADGSQTCEFMVNSRYYKTPLIYSRRVPNVKVIHKLVF